MTRTLAVDPGKSTGFALWQEDTWQEAWCETHWGDTCGQMEDFCKTGRFDGESHLVMEDFYITAHTARKSQDGKVSLHLIGVGKYLAERYGVEFFLQSPNEAKGFATDDKLKALGMWTRGVDHPRDATRHLLLHLCKERLVDLGELRQRLDEVNG